MPMVRPSGPGNFWQSAPFPSRIPLRSLLGSWRPVGLIFPPRFASLVKRWMPARPMSCYSGIVSCGRYGASVNRKGVLANHEDEYNGECFNVRPAKRQDLGTPETAEDVRPLFVGFTEGEKTPLRRVYVPSKAQLDPPVYFVKNGENSLQSIPWARPSGATQTVLSFSTCGVALWFR